MQYDLKVIVDRPVEEKLDEVLGPQKSRNLNSSRPVARRMAQKQWANRKATKQSEGQPA